MHSLTQFLDYLIHIDLYLNSFVAEYGFWTYLALFAVIFCETGLIITPFLPGDSLLFAAGSIAAQEASSLNIFLLLGLLIFASILGNQINFLVGRLIGPRIFSFKKSWLLNPKHLQEAHDFYECYGGKTIIFARFIPIIRTFVPFIAGIALMRVSSFLWFNVLSAIIWIGSLLSLGYFLGSLPLIKQHFSLVIYGLICLSILPPLMGFILKRAREYNSSVH